MNMEGIKNMGLGELRAELSDRVDAAHFHGEPTIIRNAKKDTPRAALIPYSWLEELYALRAEKAAAGGNAN